MLKVQLKSSVMTNLSNEIHSLRDQIFETIGPYSRFVRIEQEKISKLTTTLQSIRVNIHLIRSKMN